MRESRASVRRAWLRLPDASAERRALGDELATRFGDATAEVRELLVDYLLDPRGGALLATSDARTAWLDAPMFEWVGPGNAAPHDDSLAAAVAAPALVVAGALSARLVAARWAPRADDAVALAVAALPVSARGAAVAALFEDRGPDHAVLALSAVQCGRCIAWSPSLLDEPIGGRVIEALIAMLEPTRPRPLLDEIARALGPIAARSGQIAARVREAALAGIAAASARPVAAFSAELATIGRTRALPDEDRMRALPRKEIAAACAYILGFAAPHERAAFAEARARVLEGEDSDELLAPFIDGLAAAAHAPALTELVRGMLAGDADDAAAALGLAATLPLDELGPRLIDELDSPTDVRRLVACGAVELLDDADVDAALAARLADPTPEVVAAAARTLVARGRQDLLAAHADVETRTLPHAIVRTALGALDVPVIGELVRDALDAAAAGEATSIAQLLGDALLHSVAGLEVAAELLTGVPAAVGALALAMTGDGVVRDVGVLAPPGVRAAYAGAILRIATQSGEAYAGEELATLAMYLLARVSAGDETIADVVADALAVTDGEGGNLAAALGELRVSTARTGDVLAIYVAPAAPIGARVIAAAACGRAMPFEHPAWVHVRELLDLGTIARAAAWSALRDRARRR